MNKRSMKNWALIGLIAAFHVAIVSAPVFLHGCGTPQAASPSEPPPAPVLPPPSVPDPGVPPLGAPILIPPAPERPATPGPIAAPREVAATEHVIAPGESLSKIAARHGMSTRELAEINGIKDPNKIRIGQKITIPAHSGAAVRKDPVAAAARKTAAGTEYVVQSGDCLSKIAVMHGVKVADLKEANGLGSDTIRAGQKLVLPAGARKTPAVKKETPRDAPPAPAPAPAPAPIPEPTLSVEPAPAPAPMPTDRAAPAAPAPAPTLGSARQPIKYPVSEGETLDSIAKAFLVSPESLLKLNKLADASQVKPNMTILIPIAD
jgi:LysM repeat protein